jgi:hypothetical protein
MSSDKILSRKEIYEILLRALKEKRPKPPRDWSVVKLGEEIYRATKEYESDMILRQEDALHTALYYLTDFARRMPDRVDLTENTMRVREICEDLAKEIERITLKPEEVIEERGKLKVWLQAILSVQTCLIYGDETERHIAERERVKKEERLENRKKQAAERRKKETDTRSLAKQIWKDTQDRQTDQPSLF